MPSDGRASAPSRAHSRLPHASNPPSSTPPPVERRTRLRPPLRGGAHQAGPRRVHPTLCGERYLPLHRDGVGGATRPPSVIPVEWSGTHMECAGGGQAHEGDAASTVYGVDHLRLLGAGRGGPHVLARRQRPRSPPDRAHGQAGAWLDGPQPATAEHRAKGFERRLAPRQVKDIAEDPLNAGRKKAEEEDSEGQSLTKIKKEDAQFETKILENSIMKICSLLAVGFGEAGTATCSFCIVGIPRVCHVLT
eukprot:scaffold2903_cov336-Prasinococcus_capsulatus_cf.AAC.4